MDTQNNQQSGSSPQGGQQKPQQMLSWSQPTSQGQGKTTTTSSQNNKQIGVNTMPRPAGSQSSSRLIWAFVIGLIVGWLLTWSWFDLRSKTPASSSEMATTTQEMGGGLSVTQTSGNTASSMTSSNNTTSGTMTSSTSTVSGGTTTQGMMSSDTVTVPSPQPAGTSVAVTNISGTDSVWAVVYEDQNGTPGRALGAARFSPERTSGTVELLRATLPNLTYFVGLSADTPLHTFDVHTNTPLVNAQGARIMTQFTAE